MKLVHPEWSFQVDISEEKVPVIYIENPRYYSQIIGEFINQCKKIDGRFVLSNGSKEIAFDKFVDFIFNPFILDLNERKIIAKLYQYLESNVVEDYFSNKMEMSIQMLSFIDKLISDQDYPLTYNQEISIQDVFKIVDIKFDLDAGKLVEQVIEYLKISRSLCKYELFIFVNLKNFINEEDLEVLMRNCIYEKINILLLESNITYESGQYEKKYVIDRDLCDLH